MAFLNSLHRSSIKYTIIRTQQQFHFLSSVLVPFTRGYFSVRKSTCASEDQFFGLTKHLIKLKESFETGVRKWIGGSH